MSGRDRAGRAFVAERRAKAIELRIAGVDVVTIANELGYSSPARVSEDVTRALAERKRRQDELAGDLSEIIEQRLERMIRAFWSRVVVNRDVNAARVVLGAMEQLRKLRGLDAPAKAIVQVLDNEDAAIESLVKEIVAYQQGAAERPALEAGPSDHEEDASE